MMKKLFLILAAVSLFAGCAKNRDRENLRRDKKLNVLSKTGFISPNADGTRGVWLGKMTVINTSDSPAGTLFVGYQGDVQVGYFDFDQYQMKFRSLKGLQEGVETENIKNPVLMSWNVDHIDYALNEVDGQTTNKEIESDFKIWNEKRSFRIRWSDQKEIANSTQMFPVSSFSFFQCWSPVNISRVPGSMKVESDAINFNVEVVYQRLPACGNMAQWAEGDFNFTATFKYSFRKMEPSDYKPKFYSNEQDPARYKYGHFQTVRKVLNKDGRPHNIFMENRWAEKTHYFYYVKGFPQKYKWIWDHTKPQSVFGQTNKLLENAGSKLRFEIYEYNHNHATNETNGPEREFGDLRYSFINFIDQLEAGGTPLGYGPSDTNPFTGEIIAANSMVWTGFLGYYMQLMQDVSDAAQEESDLFSQMNRSLNVSANNTETIESLVSDWDQTQGIGKLFKEMAQESRFTHPVWNSYTFNEVGELVVPTQMDFYNDQTHEGIPVKGFQKTIDLGFFSNVMEQAVAEVPFTYEKVMLNGRPVAKFISPLKPINLDWLQRLPETSGTGQYSHSLRPVLDLLDNMQQANNKHFHGAGDLKTISEQMIDHEMRHIHTNQQGHCILDMEDFASGLAGVLKAGKIDLSNPEVRQDLINTVLYRVSIHEFGHNLNLRHNFYGSIDKENFTLGQKKSIASFPGTNGLTKFKVDRVGNFVSLGEGRKQVSSSVMDYLRLEDEVDTPWAWEEYDVAAILDSYGPQGFDDKGHLYLYCTDEHTATSAICNRHDFGTTPTQVLMSQIRSYDERYEMRNKRYGRAYWNTSGYSMGMLRTMFSFKEFIAFWRGGLAEDLLTKKLSEMGIKNPKKQAPYITAMNREMLNTLKMSMAFFDGVIQQSRASRDYRSIYDPVTGALKQIGIMPDKIFAMLVVGGDDAIFFNPDRVSLENSYLTYSGSPTIAQYADRFWRNILTDRQIAMDPWFINFSRVLYAKNATNYSNRGAASLINSMKIIKIENAEDLKRDYGIEMDLALPTLQTRLPKAVTGTFEKDEEVVVIHIDGDYYMTSISEGDVTYSLFQGALDKVTGAGDDEESINQFNMDVIEFHWLYNLARSGQLQ